MFFSRDECDDLVDRRNEELRKRLKRVEIEMRIFDTLSFNTLADNRSGNETHTLDDALRELESAQRITLSRASREMRDKHKRVLRGSKRKRQKQRGTRVVVIKR